MTKALCNKAGFTLIELIVVIVIIGILAAVAAPIMMSNITRAKRTEAISAMGTIRAAEQMYHVEWRTGYTEYLIFLKDYVKCSDLNGQNYNFGNYSVDVSANVISATGNLANGGNCNMNLVTGEINEQ